MHLNHVPQGACLQEAGEVAILKTVPEPQYPMCPPPSTFSDLIFLHPLSRRGLQLVVHMNFNYFYFLI